MKKRIALVLLAILSCICFAVGLSACNQTSNPGGTTGGENGGTTECTHVAGEAVKENEVAATCTANGEYDLVVYCTECGEKLSSETVSVPATGHTAAEAVKEDEVAATCTETGSYYNVVYCSVCNTELSADKVTVPATGHTAAEAVKESEVAATCTTDGSYQSVVYCSVCNAEISRTTEAIKAPGHTPANAVKESEVAATCTTAGSYDSVVYCSVCHEKLSSSHVTVDALNHSYNDGVVTTAPTCTEKGVKTYTCTRCDYSYTEELDALGHDYVEEKTKEPTITETGLYTYTCSRCNDSYTKDIAVLGHTHDYEGEVTTAATCYQKGVMTYTCKYCTESYTEEIDELDHTLVQVEAKAATCTSVGWSAYEYCTVSGCGYTTYEEIAMTDHTSAEAVKENVVEATCTTTGSYNLVVRCSVCNTIMSSVYETIPATGHTYSNDWTYNESYHWHAATCEHNLTQDTAAHTFELDNNGRYTCNVCGYEDTTKIYESFSTVDIGENYIILSSRSSSSYLQNLTLSVTKAGTYTFSIPTDCQGLVYIYDTLGDMYRLGDAGYTDISYSISIDASVGETITLSYICASENASFEGAYMFCLTITYVSKDISPLGSEDNPYTLNNPNYTSDGYYNGSVSFNANIAAGESYYFTLTRNSETLTEIYFYYTSQDGSTDSSLELYINGTKVEYEASSSTYEEYDTSSSTYKTIVTIYGTYYFSAETTTITFYLKNVGSYDISTNIRCDVYQPSLSKSNNELEITSAMLDSTNSITYYVTLSSSSAYTISLGDGTDSNVTIYYNGEKTSNSITGSESTLILGYGASSGSYLLSNTNTKDKSYLLTITYTGTTIPDSIKVYLNFVKTEIVTEYTTITLGTKIETALDYSTGATSANFKYEASAEGTYTLTLQIDGTWSSTYTSTATVTINGTTVSGTDEGVYTFTLNAGENIITVYLSTSKSTLSATLTSGGRSTEVTATALNLGDNTVANGTLYSFTPTEAGSYTFTPTGAGDTAIISAGESVSSTVYYDAQEKGDDEHEQINVPFTLKIAANETVYLYMSGTNDSFTLTITKN